MRFFHFTTKWLLKKHVNKLIIPPFNHGELVRYRISFFGKVQRVGFRAELELIAHRIGITGFVLNSGKNHVIAETQGTQEMISSLLELLKTEKRFILKEIKMEQLETIKNELEFKIK